ncbi:MAG: preprotein translocase subunit SecE [Patescibacteria group bacterium]|jgi:preprotein translocase SecE subunit
MTNPIINYFKTSWMELKKVTWPTRAVATQHALLVVAVSAIVAVFFGIVDYLLTLGLARLL